MTDSADRTSALGRTLRMLREARGWSRETLAGNAGVGVATISRIELYGRTPSLGVLYLLAGALEEPIGTFFNDEDAA